VFDGLRYSIQLSRLQRSKRRISDACREDIARARAEKKTDEEIEGIESSERSALASVDDNIAFLQTRFLIQQAQRLLVPTPPWDGGPSWSRSESTGRYHLSDAACADLRSAIRKEHRERRESWQVLFTVLTGLGGVIIGILSLALRK
jgi:hypothetical protein